MNTQNLCLLLHTRSIPHRLYTPVFYIILLLCAVRNRVYLVNFPLLSKNEAFTASFSFLAFVHIPVYNVEKSFASQMRRGRELTMLFIGNCISAIAAVFTALSSWSKDRKSIYGYQVVQCLLLSLASVFFASRSGIVTLLVCAWRNYLAARDRLTKGRILICLVLIAVFGLLVNNRGVIGLLVVFTNVIYSLGMYFAKSELAIKCNIMLNLTLWLVYEILIIDIPSAAADAIGLAAAAASLLRKNPQKSKETLL